ncbi:MAG TPA: ABC transporter permease subunit [Roseiarcus sp.]|jgi:NitT/TauT family transport system permease protein|nr:ABC transporter permease subunit [Roseiarcus sp.]
MLNTIASAGRRVLPNQWDLIAFAAIMAVLTAVAESYHGISAPLPAPNEPVVSLDYSNLPYYALRTALRMFLALFFSLVFTFTYATLAAKSRRCEMVLVPVLDVLQSVPILGFLSFTVTFFLGLFPGNTLGAELAAIFAIFTSQAWNMAFSFYQSLRTVPRDLEEVARGFRLTGWQKFWQLEAPFAMPGLIWNTMMSMSGGWFFVVASEGITVGDTTITLPGVGSYIAKANDEGNWSAIGAAIMTMAIVILLYDQLLFRPIVAWADKFRVELSAGQEVSTSWVLNLLQRTYWLRLASQPIFAALRSVSLLPIRLPQILPAAGVPKDRRPARILDAIWILVILAIAIWAAWLTVRYIATEVGWDEVSHVFVLTVYTLIRVFLLIVLATVIWVPISVWVGLRPRWAEAIQPIAQFLAAFPVNLLFGATVSLILAYDLNTNIWLSFLIIFGTQWYIVFNTIGGAAAFPNDLNEAAKNFRIRGWRWWWQVIIPGIAPYYLTGAITASGGSWNASIVAEYVKWKDHTVRAAGVGSYIAEATDKGDFPKIVLGVAMMSLFVTLFNRLFWRQLYAFAERRLRL